MKIDLSEAINILKELDHSLRSAAHSAINSAQAAHFRSDHEAFEGAMGRYEAYRTASEWTRHEIQSLTRQFDTDLSTLKEELSKCT